MICKEIVQRIEASYPREAALSFDNVGLLAGRMGKHVSRVYLALDATDEVISHAIESCADLLVTHHPLIFSPLKQVTDEDFISRRVLRLIQNDLSYYAMHTNYDVIGMGKLAERILGLKKTRVLDVTSSGEGKEELGIGRVGLLEQPMSLQECCDFVKHRMKLESVRVFGNLTKEISKVAISPGSGKSSILPALCAEADVLITGDIGHHDGLDAVEQGLAVIDAGHYGTEYIFLDDMKRFFEERMPELVVETEPVTHPFCVI